MMKAATTATETRLGIVMVKRSLTAATAKQNGSTASIANEAAVTIIATHLRAVFTDFGGIKRPQGA